MTTVIQWNPNYDTAVSQFREPDIDVPCLIPWRFIYIQEHSHKVVGCPYHTIPYGDLDKMSLQEIWNSKPIQEMRGSLLQRQIPRFCLNHSAACPVIAEAHANGYAPPAEAEIVFGENDYWFLGPGWFGLERIPEPVRWSAGNADFRIRTTASIALQIEMMTLREGLDSSPLTGSVWLGAKKLGRFSLDAPQWRTLIFPLAAADRMDEAHARLTVDETWTPPSKSEFGDTRKLGVAVRRIAVI